MSKALDLTLSSCVLLQADLGMEIHVLSSAGKPIAGWIARDAIQACREACGGHGYLKGIVSFLQL
jgi:alkylation response protein AidB-like acyl-CoA dehydrogenase